MCVIISLAPRSRRDLFFRIAPSNPLPLSLARDVSVLVAKSHPHARKNSVVDGGIYHPHEIVSTGYSLSLDPIAENASPLPPQTPSYPSVSPHPERGSHLYTLGQNDTMESVVRESITESVHRGDVQDFQRQPPGPLRGRGIGLGLPSSVSHLVNRRGSSTFSPPGAETLLWAYAQFVGTVELDKQQVPFDSIENLRRALRKRTVVGGGSMDISSTSSSRSGGMLSSLFSSSSTSSSRRSWLSSLAALGDSTNHDDQLPTFESQPSMLVVDLNLAPGESRSCALISTSFKSMPPIMTG